MDTDIFNVLLLIARPAAGKSEIIHYLKQTMVLEHTRSFHIGEFEEIDDFPMLWTWFEEDHLLQEMGYPRLHTDRDGYFSGHHMWDLLVERIGLEYRKKLRDRPDYHDDTTVIIEFSRGVEHGGYARAFKHLSEQVVRRLAVLYVRVSWQESLRKNRKRFNPNHPDSILEHGLPDDKLERLYREDDWDEISAGSSEFLPINGFDVPYAVLENEDDVTTAGGELLGRRLEQTLSVLWERYSKLHNSM